MIIAGLDHNSFSTFLLPLQICPNLTNLNNFHPLEVVGRVRSTQSQVGGNSNEIRIARAGLKPLYLGCIILSLLTISMILIYAKS